MYVIYVCMLIVRSHIFYSNKTQTLETTAENRTNVLNLDVIGAFYIVLYLVGCRTVSQRGFFELFAKMKIVYVRWSSRGILRRPCLFLFSIRPEGFEKIFIRQDKSRRHSHTGRKQRTALIGRKFPGNSHFNTQ